MRDAAAGEYDHGGVEDVAWHDAEANRSVLGRAADHGFAGEAAE